MNNCKIYHVNPDNNKCWVFQMPELSGFTSFYNFPDYRFSLVDGFKLHLETTRPAVEVEGEVNEVISSLHLESKLVPVIQKKPYIREGKQYLVLCDFGASLMFKGKRDNKVLPNLIFICPKCGYTGICLTEEATICPRCSEEMLLEG